MYWFAKPYVLSYYNIPFLDGFDCSYSGIESRKLQRDDLNRPTSCTIAVPDAVGLSDKVRGAVVRVRGLEHIFLFVCSQVSYWKFCAFVLSLVSEVIGSFYNFTRLFIPHFHSTAQKSESER